MSRPKVVVDAGDLEELVRWAFEDDYPEWHVKEALAGRLHLPAAPLPGVPAGPWRDDDEDEVPYRPPKEVVRLYRRARAGWRRGHRWFWLRPDPPDTTLPPDFT